MGKKKTIPRKLLERCYIKNNKNKCINLNDGLYASAQYGVGEKAWLRGNIKREREGGNYHRVPNTQFQPE